MSFIHKKLSTIKIAAVSLFVLMGCQKNARQGEVSAENLVENNPSVNRTIGDEQAKFVVLGNQAFMHGAQAKKIRLANSKEAQSFLNSLASRDPVSGAGGETPPVAGTGVPREGSLVLGFPVGLIPEHQIFGGVITKVSDTESEDLGRLKLTDLDPLHVRLGIAKDGENYFLAIQGCVMACTENSPLVPLLGIPILGVDEAKQVLMLDLAALGEGMNLVEILDPEGSFTKLKPKSSKVVAFDYSMSTLVFDVEATMVPLDPEAPVVEKTFTTRWYLKLTSASNPAFVAREATEGVGYFMTARAAVPKIQRFSSAPVNVVGTAPVKYFVKNVPNQFKPAFAGAFDEWNEKFTEILGRKLVEYEFVDAEDPRSGLLVPGDVRYNIVEWDLVNRAPYGGLGPSYANQHTGEILTANVLVQGPHIVKMYTEWFNTGSQVERLIESGHLVAAEAVLKKGLARIESMNQSSGKRFALTLGKDLKFNVRSQMPELEDPAMKRQDFEPIPAGFTFETYMPGYFHDLVGHELGHNLGLRHNFRGNLSAANPIALGAVSHSIMEYLGRGFRHLDKVGNYDVMALKYGYLGVAPDNRGLFCTDENVPSIDSPADGSAECSRDDATHDPFAFFDKRLAFAVDKLVARGVATAPSWNLADMDTELTTAVTGMALYAATAETTGSKWTNFFTGGERPENPSGVPAYVAGKLKSHLCDASLAGVIAGKESAEAKEKTEANIKALREKVKAVVAPLAAIQAASLECASE